MVKKYDVHPSFDEVCESMEILKTATPEVYAAMNKDFRDLWAANESDDEVRVTKLQIAGYEGGMVDVQMVEPVNATDKLPAFLFFHAGAWLVTGMPHHIKLVKEYALEVNCKVFYIDYRLLPEQVYPAALYDCYALLEHVYENADALGIDRDRMIVGGDSAGGNMTAGVCMMARDKNGPAIRGQMLIFPTLDVRLNTESMKNFTDTPVWNANLTKMLYDMFFANGDFGIRHYVSVVESDSLADMPQAYVETAEFDCLRDEGIDYARLLEEAGVPVILNETRRTVHCYDMALDSPITRESMAARISFLRNALEQ